MKRMLPVAFMVLWNGGAFAAADDPVRVVEEVDYVAGREYADGKDRLDLYLPEGRDDFPVVVYFHGGGLRAGDKSGSEHVGRALAAQGIGAAVANYRLSPTVSHPEHAEDAARAIAWVRRNVEEHGGDPTRIFVAGHSAGGYLAALLALDPRYLRAEGMSPADLAGSIPISGFFYVDRVAPDRPKDVWGEVEAAWKDASPSAHLASDAPPLLLLYADGDDAWRREQNESFARALRDEGHDDVAAVQIAGRDHRGIAGRIASGDETLVKMQKFIAAR